MLQLLQGGVKATYNIDSHLAAIVRALLDAGMGIKLHPDPEAYRDFAKANEGHDPATPLDSAFVDISAKNFFWVQILSPEREAVAICAARCLDMPVWRGGLTRILNDQSFFNRRGALPFAPRMAVHGLNLHGKLGYIGGGWTHPQWRRKQLIGLAVQFAQATLVKSFRADHTFGFVRPKHIPLALSATGYGFCAAARAAVPYCLGTGFPEELYLAHAPRQSLLERYSEMPQYTVTEQPIHSTRAKILEKNITG